MREARSTVAGSLVNQFLNRGQLYQDGGNILSHHSPVVIKLSGRQRAEDQSPTAPSNISVDPGSASNVLDHEAVLVTAWAVLQVKLRHLEADPGVRRRGVQDPLTGDTRRVVTRPVTWAGQRLQVTELGFVSNESMKLLPE